MQNNKLIYYQNVYEFLNGLPNIHMNFGPVTSPNTHPLEQVYIHNIFKNLSQWSGFDNYNYYIIGSNATWNFKIDESSVVFYLSNEDHTVPELLNKAKAVFSPYSPILNCPINCHPIPLGYNGSLGNIKMKPINERKYNIFFSGNIHKRRIPFYLNLQYYLKKNGLKSYFQSDKKNKNKINFTRSFGGGMSPQRYSSVLMNSKIALVPEGYKSNNTFRFFEACKYGNLIVTKKLYDYWFYKDFPGIQLESWKALPSTLNRLLKQPQEIEDIHIKTLEYYNKYCAESAVSQYILSKLS